MVSMLRHRTTVIWLLLVFATAGSWVLGSENRGTALMLVAFIKVRLVGLHFMELRSAPLALRTLFRGLRRGCLHRRHRHVRPSSLITAAPSGSDQVPYNSRLWAWPTWCSEKACWTA